MRGEHVRWRVAGVALFALACGIGRLRGSLVGDERAAMATGLSLIGFCLALVGVMLIVSGRHWLERAAGRGSGPMPVVRSRAPHDKLRHDAGSRRPRRST